MPGPVCLVSKDSLHYARRSLARTVRSRQDRCSQRLHVVGWDTVDPYSCIAPFSGEEMPYRQWHFVVPQSKLRTVIRKHGPVVCAGLDGIKVTDSARDMPLFLPSGIAQLVLHSACECCSAKPNCPLSIRLEGSVAKLVFINSAGQLLLVQRCVSYTDAWLRCMDAGDLV